MTNKIISFSFLCALVAVLFSTPAAAVMKSLSTIDLTEGSEIVLTGSVNSVESHWAKNKSAIVSRASITIEEIIKGSYSESKLTVEYDGREIDGVGFGVSDAVHFVQGEKVFLFLKSGMSKKDGSLIFNLIGSAQGKYAIDNNGICKKSGFAVIGKPGTIDNNIKCEKLSEIVKGAL
ncbi:MAG TPA: hypothetical protein QF468_10750 [Nitrospinota bacterium]|jgi:hypothetical protein|nr:hypothetical protein [Nitrospinota bacterium]